MPKVRMGGRVVYVPVTRVNMAPPATNVRQQAGTTTIDESAPWADATDTEMRILRASMGQTGDEAGKARKYQGDPDATYIQTSKSYLINNYLRNGDITDGYMTDGSWHWVDGYWDSKGNYTKYTNQTAEQAIRGIDAGMKPLTKDIKTERYEGLSGLASYNNGKSITSAQLQSMTQSQLDNMFVGKQADNPAYISASWRMDPTSARDRNYMREPVKKEYTFFKGTKAVVTNNITEHEVLADRGYREECVAVKMVNGQLVMRIEVRPENQQAWRKV